MGELPQKAVRPWWDRGWEYSDSVIVWSDHFWQSLADGNLKQALHRYPRRTTTFPTVLTRGISLRLRGRAGFRGALTVHEGFGAEQARQQSWNAEIDIQLFPMQAVSLAQYLHFGQCVR